MTPRRSLIVLLFALSVAVRLVPYALARLGEPIDPESTAYPWNFSPILPICLFGGAVYARREWVFAIPLAVYLLGDVGIWMLTGRPDWAFYADQPVVYLSVAMVAAAGFALRRERTWPRVAAVGLGSSIGFFLVTNFGVWAFGGGAVYPHTLAGLGECYVLAIPFLRNTLVSMAVFLPILFSRVGLKATVAAARNPLAATAP